MKKLSILSLSSLGLLALAACNKQEEKTNTIEKVEGKTYYVSPTGLSSNDGSLDNPKDVRSALENASKGDTILLKEGVYATNERFMLNQSGDELNPITVKALDNKKVVFDFTTMPTSDLNRGIQVNGNYWYFYGIDVKGAGDNGMYIGGSYNTVEFCEFYDNRDTGLQLGRANGQAIDIKDWPHNNLIKNCTSYNNNDYHTFGENADGFAAKLTVGEYNIFDGCIAYRNSDDGWDLYAKSDSGNVGTTIIVNCVAFENGWLLDGTQTRDGDGIGFKLGGSNMAGDVIIENCQTFNNRLHGVSDNSNPGVLTLKNITAYNNSVRVLNRVEYQRVNGLDKYVPGYKTFGENDGQSDNINTARTNESYNNYYGIVSYSTNQITPEGMQTRVYENYDDFKGSCGYSIFKVGENRYNQIKDFIDASSYDFNKIGSRYNGLSDDSFASLELPENMKRYVEFDENDNEIGRTESLHKKLRNPDGSINMGDVLKITDSKLLTFGKDGEAIGANLSKSKWEDYNHYDYSYDFTNMTRDEIDCQKAIDSITIMCNPNAVYQNLNLRTLINGIPVEWSSDDKHINITTKKVTSLSLNEYIIGEVLRDHDDKEVTLTATVQINDTIKQKKFKLNVKSEAEFIGEIEGYDIRYITNLYDDFKLPKLKVTDGNSTSKRLLTEGVDYTIETSFEYGLSTTSKLTKVSKIYTSIPGVYKVTQNIILTHNIKDSKTISYNVYVVSPDAPIDFTTDNDRVSYYKFDDAFETVVSRDGFDIHGVFTNISGYLYVLVDDNETASKDDVINKGIAFDITDETLKATVKNANDKGYFVHVVVTNTAKSHKTDVYTKQITTQSIKTRDDFYNMVTSSTKQTVIYLLENDLDFEGYTWNMDKHNKNTSTFNGLFNGQNHKISNLTINSDTDRHSNIFYKVKGGTIMNVVFENMLFDATLNAEQVQNATRAAIIGQMCGGYLHNIKLKNISSRAYQSAAGLVGQVCGGVNYISQVSLTNDDNQEISVSSKYCGGIVANAQKDTQELVMELYMDNIYVNAKIGNHKDSGGYISSVLGRIKNDSDVYIVKINHAVCLGVVDTNKNYAAGVCGGCDNGAGYIEVTNSVSDIVLIYCTKTYIKDNEEVSYPVIIDGKTIDPQSGQVNTSIKNGSPIFGRHTAGTGKEGYANNFARFTEYSDLVNVDTDGFDFIIKTKDFFVERLGLDLENIWIFDEETKTISLR
jgi:hypothetical protein